MTEREEFEAWAKLNNFNVQRQPADEKFADYMSLTTERAWQAWQAARAVSRQEPEKHLIDAAMDVARFEYGHGVTRSSIVAIWRALVAD